MKECLFCRIVEKKEPAFVIYEDDTFLVFLDINPIREGHVLLIPKFHCAYLFELENEALSKLFLKAKEMSKILEKALHVARIGIFVSGISVPHVHVHLLPVFTQKDLDPCLAKPASTEELLRLQKKILDV